MKYFIIPKEYEDAICECMGIEICCREGSNMTYRFKKSGQIITILEITGLSFSEFVHRIDKRYNDQMRSVDYCIMAMDNYGYRGYKDFVFIISPVESFVWNGIIYNRTFESGKLAYKSFIPVRINSSDLDCFDNYISEGIDAVDGPDGFRGGILRDFMIEFNRFWNGYDCILPSFGKIK